MSMPNAPASEDETLEEKEARLVRELEPLKREKARDLERGVEGARARVRPVSGIQGEQSRQTMPTSGSQSSAPVNPETSVHDLPTLDRHTQPGSASIGPSVSRKHVQDGPRALAHIHGAIASGGHLPALGGIDMGVLKLQHYQELTEPADGDAELLFYDMDLEELRSIGSTWEENPQGDVRQIKSLSSVYYTIFLRSGGMDELQNAIDRAEEAVFATHMDDQNYAFRLRDLIVMLVKKYEHTSSLEDLESAILRAEEMIVVTPPLHPDRLLGLMDLFKLKLKRSLHTLAHENLDEAMFKLDQSQDQPAILHTVAVSFYRSYMNTGNLDDLHRAIDRAEEALLATPVGHPYQAAWLNNLGAMLGIRFQRTGEMDDINRAVEVTEKAVEATPLDHPNRAGTLNNLGNQLDARFKRTGEMDDLNRAVEVAYQAVEATPLDHPGRAGWLSSLGDRLVARFERTGDGTDFSRSLFSFKEGWNCSSARPSARIHLARKSAAILISQRNWEESSKFLEGAVEPLPTFHGLASTASAISLEAGKEPHHALKLLELGRGVISGLLMEMRIDTSALKAQHPKLAKEFTSLRNGLDSPTSGQAAPTSSDSSSHSTLQTNDRLRAEQRFTEVITKIRALSGFHNFLLPPTADELMEAAGKDSIVVVNLSPYRCDAFLVERHQIRSLKLPAVDKKTVNEKLQHLRSSRFSALSATLGKSVLEWLWHAIAHPCLQALGFEQTMSALSLTISRSFYLVG